MKTVEDAKQAVATSERLANAMGALTKVNKAVSCSATLKIRIGNNWGDHEDYKIDGGRAFDVVRKAEVERLLGVVGDCVRKLRQLEIAVPHEAVELMEKAK